MSAVQTMPPVTGYALPVDPVALATLPGDIFEVRHILRELHLDDEQIACAEAAVELARQGHYPAADGGAT